MPKPRKSLVSLDVTPYYHCVSRCVRRAFLCGRDRHTGRSFEHRRQWAEERILLQGKTFAIDVCAYAVLENHYHLVLHIDRAKAENWSDLEVIERWHRLYQGHALSARFLAGESISATEWEALSTLVALWRQRLMDLSWFMGCLNEYIARKANKEDECTGHFWEGRYKSEALLDEPALLTCMTYVDLNPVRAKIANTPESSDYTSIKRRIEYYKKHPKPDTRPEQSDRQPPELISFAGIHHHETSAGLPFELRDYLTLVDWTGRAIRDDKAGTIAKGAPPILTRLHQSPELWLISVTHFERHFKGLIGARHKVRHACANFGKRWVHGIRNCERLLPNP